MLGRALRMTLLASTCAIGLAFVPDVSIANHSIDLNIRDRGQNFFPGPPTSDSYAFGDVDPGPTQCRAERTFKLFKNTGPAKILIDTDRSSRNGFWALGGDLSGSSAVLIKMQKKRFGPRGNRHTCEEDTITYGIS
jgi:hypothetical protein